MTGLDLFAAKCLPTLQQLPSFKRDEIELAVLETDHECCPNPFQHPQFHNVCCNWRHQGKCRDRTMSKIALSRVTRVRRHPRPITTESRCCASTAPTNLRNQPWMRLIGRRTRGLCKKATINAKMTNFMLRKIGCSKPNINHPSRKQTTQKIETTCHTHPQTKHTSP